MLRTLGQGIDVCVTVTLIDGLVLARSAFSSLDEHRSSCLRSCDPDWEEAFLQSRGLYGPVRTYDSRTLGRCPGALNERDANRTTVLSLAFTEASAKVRTGPPLDDEEDYSLPVCRVIPLVGLRRIRLAILA